MILSPWLTAETVANALGWTLIDTLWQGVLLALLLAIVWQRARRWTAASRYGLCAVALLVLAVMPAVTFLAFIGPHGGSTTAHYAPARQFLTKSPLRLLAAGAGTSGRGRELFEAAIPWITATWAFGVLVLSLRRVGGWLWLMRVRKTWEEASANLRDVLAKAAESLGMARLPLLKVAPGGFSPFVIGWLRPVIVLPAATIVGVSAADLEALLAHELAHIRREDYLVNILQTGVETLLFYHPLVWWLSRQMRVEREHCCDDLAVRACGDRVRYARALVDLAGQAPVGQAPATQAGESPFAMAGSGGSLAVRVKRLLGGDAPAGRLPVWPVLMIAVGVCALLIGPSRGVHAAAQVSQLPGPALENPTQEEAKPSPFEEAERSAEQSRAAVEAQVAQIEKNVAEAQARAASASADADNDSDDQKGDWLSGMTRSGLRGLSIDDLIQLRQHGVSPELAKEAVRASPNTTAKDLIEIADHGVDMDYIRDMRKLLGTNLGLRDLAQLRDHGVDPEFVAEMRKLLGANLSAEELVKLRDHGVDPEFVASMRGFLGGELPAKELVDLHNHGVDGAFVRRLSRNGFTKLSADQLIRMKDAGL